jgi:hypothetical protein
LHIALTRVALEIGMYCLEKASLNMYFEVETAGFSEKLLITYQITRCQNPEDDKVEVLSIF